MKKESEVVTINSKGKILTSSDEVLFDSEDFKTLSNKIDEVNVSLNNAIEINVNSTYGTKNADNGYIKAGMQVVFSADIYFTSSSTSTELVLFSGLPQPISDVIPVSLRNAKTGDVYPGFINSDGTIRNDTSLESGEIYQVSGAYVSYN